MCLAIPGKIVKIKGDNATIEYPGEKREASLIEKDFMVGDYVIVQNKVVVKKITPSEAKQSIELFKKLK